MFYMAKIRFPQKFATLEAFCLWNTINHYSRFLKGSSAILISWLVKLAKNLANSGYIIYTKCHFSMCVLTNCLYGPTNIINLPLHYTSHTLRHRYGRTYRRLYIIYVLYISLWCGHTFYRRRCRRKANKK